MSATDDLASWTQSRLAALYSAPDDAAFSQAYDRAFAPGSRFNALVNGVTEEREAHMEALRRIRTSTARPADVAFEDVVVEEDEDGKTATVKGACTVHRALKIRVRAGPAERERKIQFEAKIETDPSFVPNDADDNDMRRIVHLTENFEDKQLPFTVHPTGHVGETAAGV